MNLPTHEPHPRRCRATNTRGEPCGAFAVSGATVCRVHGGMAPQVQRKAKQRLEEAADRMAKELLGIATSAESEAVKLNAVRDALDRAGLGAKQKVEVEVEPQPWEQLFAGIASISREDSAAGRGRVLDAEIVPPPELPAPERPAQPAERSERESVRSGPTDYPAETPTPPTGRSDTRPTTARSTGFMTAEEAAADQHREQQRRRRSGG